MSTTTNNSGATRWREAMPGFTFRCKLYLADGNQQEWEIFLGDTTWTVALICENVRGWETWRLAAHDDGEAYAFLCRLPSEQKAWDAIADLLRLRFEQEWAAQAAEEQK